MKTQLYNQKFVKHVLKAFREIKKGKYITIDNPKNIWSEISTKKQ